MNVKNNFMQFGKEELIKAIKAARLDSNSEMEKEDLSQLLSEHIFSDKNVKYNMLQVDEKSMKYVEQLISGEVVKLNDAFRLKSFLDTGYIELDKTNRVVKICDDVSEKFLVCYTDKFKQQYTYMNEVSRYCSAFSNLDGIISIEKEYEIYNKHHDHVSFDDFLEVVRLCEKRGNFGEVYENHIAAEYILAFDEFNAMRIQQADKPYYIPSKKKLMRYADDFYIDEINDYIELKRFLLNEMHLDERIVEAICEDTEMECRMDFSINYIFAVKNIKNVADDKLKVNMRRNIMIMA